MTLLTNDTIKSSSDISATSDKSGNNENDNNENKIQNKLYYRDNDIYANQQSNIYFNILFKLHNINKYLFLYNWNIVE